MKHMTDSAISPESIAALLEKLEHARQAVKDAQNEESRANSATCSARNEVNRLKKKIAEALEPYRLDDRP